MSDITPLNASGMTPEVVLELIAKEVSDLDSLFVVGVAKDGNPIVWSSGDIMTACYAKVVFDDYLNKILNGYL